MTTRHVDDDERRARLARRALLGAPGRRGRAPADVAAALATLHGTDPSTVHLQLHARCDADQADLDAYLHDERGVVRHTCLRRTVHVMPRDVAAMAHRAHNAGLLPRLRRQVVAWLANADVPAVAALDEPGRRRWLAALEDEVVATLRERGPLTGAALAGVVAGLRVQFEPAPGKPYSRPTRLTSKILEIVAADARITRARPVGDLTSAAWTWVAMDDWWPGGLGEPDQPLAGLLARHLATYGPATTTDLAWWTGLGKTKVRGALRTLGAERVTVAADDDEAWLLADDVAVPDPPSARHAALLPGLDATAMALKLRGFWLGELGDALYDRNGNAGPTAWVDGRAVGAWTQRDDGAVAVGLLVDVDDEARAMLVAEAERTSRWLGDVRVRPRYPAPLQRALATGSSDAPVLLGS